MPARDPAARWDDLLRALDFAAALFQRWHQTGLIRSDQAAALAAHYQQRRQEAVAARDAGQPPPRGLGLPPPADAPDEARLDAEQLRMWTFLGREVRRHEEERRLTLAQSHTCLNEIDGRRAHLRRKVELASVPDVLPIDDDEEVLDVLPVEDRPPRRPKPPRRSLLEVILDPKNIQWLLAFGGVMLVVGLALFLYISGVFDNPVFLAAVLGVGTLGLFAAGCVMMRRPNMHTAGQALALLACLVMPLNLWVYQAQQLHPFTLGELLWVPALVMCGLYLAAAVVIRHPMFAWVLVGGVTLTGLLFLASLGPDAGFAWSVLSCVTLMAVVGLVAIHAERAFPDVEQGDFTRKRFGLAFFGAGHVVLALGLVTLLLAQLYALVCQALETWAPQEPVALVANFDTRLLALGVVAAGCYAYLYSDLVVRRLGFYLLPAVFTLFWAEVLLLAVLQVPFSVELVIAVMAATALIANLLALTRPAPSPGSQPDLLLRTAAPLSLIISSLPILLGVLWHFRWLLFRQPTDTYEIGWPYVGAMLLTAVACRLGAFVYRRTIPGVSVTYFFGTAAATLVAAAGLLNVLGIKTWLGQAPLLMLIPIAYLIAARLYQGGPSSRPLLWTAHAATGVMLLTSVVGLSALAQMSPSSPFESGDLIASTVRGLLLVHGVPDNLWVALFFGVVTLFYALAVALHSQRAMVYAATATGCAVVWQLLSYAQVSDMVYLLTFAGLGVLLLVGYRQAVAERFGLADLAGVIFRGGNALLTVALSAGVLVALVHLVIGNSADQWPLAATLATLVVLSLAAAALVPRSEWRTWYVVASLIHTALTVFVVAMFSDLTPGQKLELVAVVMGVVLLLLGHVGAYREGERQSDLVSLGLILGSVLTVVPLVVAVISWRYFNEFHLVDELGLLAVGTLLFLTGVMFRIRATTIAGAAGLVLWLTTLLIYLPWTEWQRQLGLAAILLMAGGGTIFLLGVVLSVNRQRLLALPELVRKRQGVFRVLSWR